MLMNKACPVVLRKTKGHIEILVFRHPIAGNQIVKGTIEPGESLQGACERELCEESGIDAIAQASIGIWDSNYQGQVWDFYLMQYKGSLPESWEYFTKDDGGHSFSYYWEPLDKNIWENFHPVFVRAISYISVTL